MPTAHTPIASGRRDKRVFVQNATEAVVDGEPTSTWTDADPPSWQVAIEPASARALERITAGTVLSQATYIVVGPYRTDITTQSRLIYNGRILNVIGLANPEESNRELIAVCAEVVT